MAKSRGAISLTKLDRQVLKAFGSRVREIREQKKLSVYDTTGDDMPIRSRQHWQSIENGKKNINLTTIFKVARSLHVKAEELIKNLE